LLAVLRFRSRHHRDGRRHLGFRRWRARHTALAAITPRSRATRLARAGQCQRLLRCGQGGTPPRRSDAVAAGSRGPISEI